MLNPFTKINIVREFHVHRILVSRRIDNHKEFFRLPFYAIDDIINRINDDFGLHEDIMNQYIMEIYELQNKDPALIE